MKENGNKTPFSAADYDANVFKTVPYYEQFYGETISLVKAVRPDVTVWLDTGCGTGGLAIRALPEFPGARFLLCDVSSGMMDEARLRLGAYAPERVDFLPPMPTAELERANIPASQVISALQCHHYGDEQERRAATIACFNLLTPGGVYVTFENFRPESSAGVEAALAMWKEFQLSSGRSPATVAEHLSRLDKEYFPITIARHRALLLECGFIVAEVFWLSRMQAGFYAIKS